MRTVLLPLHLAVWMLKDGTNNLRQRRKQHTREAKRWKREQENKRCSLRHSLDKASQNPKIS
jgi:hypothetical protein